MSVQVRFFCRSEELNRRILGVREISLMVKKRENAWSANVLAGHAAGGVLLDGALIGVTAA